MRTATITASEPELKYATLSIPVSSQINSDTSPIFLEIILNGNPYSISCLIASIIKLGLWPNKLTPKPIAKSIYSLSSKSIIFDPLHPFVTN